jgi:DNA-directed RNA polymerase specialized sigma24 family protein
MPADDRSHDTQLLARLRSGDEAALAEFVEANRPALMGFLHARIGGHLAKKVEPDDILQDACLVGLPSKEIAQKLGKTDGAVRVMLSRSLGKLQELLGDE